MLAQVTIGLTIWTLASVVLGLIAPWFLTFHDRDAGDARSEF